MKRLFLIMAGAVLVPALTNAQSSGNFTYGTTGNTMGCVLLQNGGLSGGTSNCSVSSGGGTFACTADSDCLSILGTNSGATCVNGFCQTPNAGTGGCIGSVEAGIKTSSGKGNVFVVRPSAVIGLLTDVTVGSRESGNGGSGSSGGCFTSTLNGTICTSTAAAGIDFAVTAVPLSGQAAPATVPNFDVTYDARFVQISTNLFTAIATQCAAITNGCFLSFAESTDSAHSFDWIIGSPAAGTGGSTLASGTYGIRVQWKPSPVFQAAGIAEAAACVGPVNMTVQQNKIFSFNTVNSF